MQPCTPDQDLNARITALEESIVRMCDIMGKVSTDLADTVPDLMERVAELERRLPAGTRPLLFIDDSAAPPDTPDAPFSDGMQA